MYNVKSKESLKQFFKDQIDWAKSYYENNDDAINGYYNYFLNTLDMSKAFAITDSKSEKALGKLKQSERDSLLKEVSWYIGKSERGYGHSYPDNALSFAPIDEIEIQISGLQGSVTEDDGSNYFATNDVYEQFLKHFSESEIEEIFEKSEASDEATLNRDCLYFTPDYSSVLFTVDEEDFNKEIQERLAS